MNPYSLLILLSGQVGYSQLFDMFSRRILVFCQVFVFLMGRMTHQVEFFLMISPRGLISVLLF
jgi:hypothetical protein